MSFKFNPLTNKFDIVEGVGTGHKAVSVADDGVLVIGMPTETAMALITEVGGAGNTLVFVSKITPAINELVSDAAVYTFTTGVLTGTTGVDGNITVSVHTDGNLYIENRSASTKKFAISLLNESNS